MFSTTPTAHLKPTTRATRVRRNFFPVSLGPVQWIRAGQSMTLAEASSSRMPDATVEAQSLGGDLRRALGAGIAERLERDALLRLDGPSRARAHGRELAQSIQFR